MVKFLMYSHYLTLQKLLEGYRKTKCKQVDNKSVFDKKLFLYEWIGQMFHEWLLGPLH